MDIQVGDILKLEKLEICPCDMLIIGASTVISQDKYTCVVEEEVDVGRYESTVKEVVGCT